MLAAATYLAGTLEPWIAAITFITIGRHRTLRTHNTHNTRPQIIDMLAAATYLAGTLEPWIAAITFITIGSYIPLTIIVTEWRGK